MDAESTWPDDLAPEAFHGIIGKFVRFIAPETEADEAGVHLATSIAAGNVIGRGPHYSINFDQHHAALYGCLVGPTSGGKGQASGAGRNSVEAADSEWMKLRQAAGLSTGEGLIFHVRDARVELRPAKEEEYHLADGDGMISETIDPGVADKRVFVYESEFAQPLTAAGREGNTLSPIMRSIWDDGNAGSLTKSSPIRTTAAHVSILACVTEEELKKKLSATEMANGLGNRFIWCCVKRSKKLPQGGNLNTEVMDSLKAEMAEAVRDARRVGQMKMSASAEEVWATAYNNELTIERDGLFGAITGRASAISLRLAVLFGALDGSSVIEVPHVEAALATWRRADQSAGYLFGASTGDRLTDRIKAIVEAAGPGGIRRSEIRKELGSNNISTEKIHRALDSLKDTGAAVAEMEETAGPPAERWTATSHLHPINPLNPITAEAA